MTSVILINELDTRHQLLTGVYIKYGFNINNISSNARVTLSRWNYSHFY